MITADPGRRQERLNEVMGLLGREAAPGDLLLSFAPHVFAGLPDAALKKALAESHNGEVGVESEPGKGSTFWLRIPLADSDSFAADSESFVADSDSDRANLNDGEGI